ncbi:NAD(P)/FAD-dependent oxidoreductase [Marinomonas pollencensis]|uniref:Gamma-glutamylputrescine oxidase n=1 Tax=Marinomonas pollencensis TaxID=491954 RepID=A0A3E0DT10_9GAMM|nr:FAD-binding oxidoreductase [Marinomonas pollencensis]REG86699.1 gamma-glutamylputrescine oxidase [Marinomonas pollencensis]
MKNHGFEASYYASSANQTLSFPSLGGDIETDVCIIGGGYTGLSAALHLAEKGFQVTLLEGHVIASGASGRNGGQVCQGHNMSHAELTKKAGQDAADLLWRLSLESVELVKALIKEYRIDCDYKPGVLHVASKASHVDDIRNAVDYKRNHLGYDKVDYLDAQAVAEKLGTTHFHGGEYYRDAGHLHPLNYALGLAKAALEKGATLYERTQVIDYKAGDNPSVRTSKGTVKAKYLLFACNGYLGNLNQNAAKKIMPINNFMIATEPLPEAVYSRINPQDVAIADSKFVINYFRLSADKRMLWGGGENYSSRFPKDIGAFVQKHMVSIYPELKSANIDFSWGGTLAITLNRMPYFGHQEKNVFLAQGYSGHGVALATLGGKLMAEAVSGTAERFDVFSKVPSANFPGGTLLRWPGLVAGMLYYSLRDRLS